MTLTRSATGPVTRNRLWVAAVLAIALTACDDGGPAEPDPADPSTVEAQEAGLSAGVCRTDADCRTFSDYCTGCDCRALSTCAKDPVCSGPGVRCLVDPCRDKRAVCLAGRCTVRPVGACDPSECGPPLGLPNRQCTDGKTVAGPTGRCLRQPTGRCAWEIATCPGRCQPLPPNPCATVLCPPDTRCVAEPVVCVRAPCPPIARCVPLGEVVTK